MKNKIVLALSMMVVVSGCGNDSTNNNVSNTTAQQQAMTTQCLNGATYYTYNGIQYACSSIINSGQQQAMYQQCVNGATQYIYNGVQYACSTNGTVPGQQVNCAVGQFGLFGQCYTASNFSDACFAASGNIFTNGTQQLCKQSYAGMGTSVGGTGWGSINFPANVPGLQLGVTAVYQGNATASGGSGATVRVLQGNQQVATGESGRFLVRNVGGITFTVVPTNQWAWTSANFTVNLERCQDQTRNYVLCP